MKRSAWTDDRIGERMEAIDSTFDMLREEVQGLQEDNRQQFAALRTDFSALQRPLAQIGFGLVGVLIAAMVALIVAVA